MQEQVVHLVSLNEYTRKEIESGSAADLLAEARELTSADIDGSAVASFASMLEAGGSRLPVAQKLDAEVSGSPATQTNRQSFGQERRQHTPRGLGRSRKPMDSKLSASLPFIRILCHPPLSRSRRECSTK